MIRIGNCASSARDEFTYRNGYADHFAIRFRWDQCEHSQAWGTLRRKEIFSSDDQLRWRRRHRRIDVFRVRLFGTRRTDAESNQNEKNACGDLADGDRGKRHSTCLLAYWTPFRLIVCCVFGELHVCGSVLKTETEAFMSGELLTRPICPFCGSSRVGTLAKQITKETAWRCADCGETFKVKP